MAEFIFPRKALEKIFKDAMDLAEKKSHDYNSGFDVIGTIGVSGIADLLLNKASRLRTLSKVEGKVTSESRLDTLMDSLNYSVYGAAIEMNVWNGGKKSKKIRKTRKKRAANKKKKVAKRKAKKGKKLGRPFKKVEKNAE